MAGLNFQTFEEPDDRERLDTSQPVPKGEYFAKVVDSDLKTTKAGTGQYVELTWEINGHVVSGAAKNRKIWQRINIRNDNPEAERIGKQELNRLVKASGLTQINDTSELHGRELIIGVKIEPARGQYEASNGISYVKSKKHAPKGNLGVADLSHASQAPEGHQVPTAANQSAAPASRDLEDEIPF